MSPIPPTSRLVVLVLTIVGALATVATLFVWQANQYARHQALLRLASTAPSESSFGDTGESAVAHLVKGQLVAVTPLRFAPRGATRPVLALHSDQWDTTASPRLLTTTDYRGERVWAAMVSAGKERWLLAKVDEAEALAPYHTGLWWIGAATILILVLGGFGLLRLLRPLMAKLERTTRSLSEAQRLAHIGSWEWDVESGKLYWTDEIYDIFGLEPQQFEATYQAFLEAVHPDDRTLVEGAVQGALADKAPYLVQHRVLRPNGTERWVEERGRASYDAAGRPLRMIGTVHDITERQAAQEQLRLAGKVYEHTAEGIIITDSNAKIVDVNPAHCTITGYQREELLGKNPSVLNSGRHPPEFFRQMWDAISSDGHWNGEVWDRRKNGEIYPKKLTINAVHDKGGTVTHYVGVFSDITEVKNAEEKLFTLAHYDPLTQLPNRSLCHDRFRVALARAERSERLVGVAFVDLDRFKLVNDNFGHIAGDQLLIEVAQRLKSCVRKDDTVARISGDEFVILLNDIESTDQAKPLLARLSKSLTEPVEIEGHTLTPSASMGVAFFPLDGEDPEVLIRHADIAMYRAKQRGRGLVQYFDTTIAAAARESLFFELELRQGLACGELELHYQPQLDLQTGRVVGVEALLRWNSPDRGMVSPAEFIPLAEQSDLIMELGRYVLRRACEDAEEWSRAGLPSTRIAVNLSPRQLRDPSLTSAVQQVLAATGSSPSMLEFEVTETAVMDNIEESAATLAALKSLGIGLALDDFGTGYSSLSHLTRLPIDTIKIDRSFITEMTTSKQASDIVAAIISMAASLQLGVVAEGVEEQSQVRALLEHGCHRVQGFYLARPVPKDALPAAIRQAEARARRHREGQ